MSAVATSPSASSAPASRSESWSFIWHPKVRMWKVRGPASCSSVVTAPGYGPAGPGGDRSERRRPAGGAAAGYSSSVEVEQLGRALAVDDQSVHVGVEDEHLPGHVGLGQGVLRRRLHRGGLGAEGDAEEGRARPPTSRRPGPRRRTCRPAAWVRPGTAGSGSPGGAGPRWPRGISTRLSASPAMSRAIRDRLNAALSRLTSTGQGLAGPGGGQGDVGDDDHEGQTHVERQAHRLHAPLHPGRGHQAPHHGCGGVVGVPVHLGGHGQRVAWRRRRRRRPRPGRPTSPAPGRWGSGSGR